MKTQLFISLMLFPIISQATNHYISAAGSDANTGLTLTTTWLSIAKVNAMFSSFSTGDSVLFKRGDTFYGSLIISRSGISGSPMVIAAYGTGPKPLLLGSKQENLTTDWIYQGGNIWQNNDSSFAEPRTWGYCDVANIIFNNEAFCGVKLMTVTPTFTTQGQFWFDYSNNRLSLYSVGNPASFYTNIQCAFNENAVKLTDRTYITFKDLDFRYWGRCVWESDGSFITWQDINMSYIGGSNMEMGYTGAGRYGNGLQMWEGTSHDITITGCKIDNVYDAGISPQGYSGGFDVYNIYIRNNVITNCEYSFEFYERNTTAYAHDIYFENNTCVNAGRGWSHSQRPDGANGSCVRLCDFTGNKANIFIRNNIFCGSTQYLFQIERTSDLTNIVLDYNSYYKTSGEMVGYKQQNSGYYYTLASWKAATGQDAHSISNNPLFISATDFHLQETSPAINAGIDIGLPFSGTAPDMGAFEIINDNRKSPAVR